MTTLPVAGYISNAARTQAEAKQALEDTIAAIGELLGGKVESTLTLASDACTPTGGVHAIDSEAAASTDNLATINQTNAPDGRLLLIRAANAGHVITVKHAAGGTGQILLTDSADLVLQSTKQWLLLKRTGTSWEEVLRSYGDQKSLMRTWQQIATTPQTKSANYTAVAADRGRLLVGTGTWTLALTAAATLGSDWYLPFRNDATGEITIDPNGAELVNGAATITIGPGETGLLVCDGTGFKTIGEPLSGRLIGVRVFSTPGTSTYTPTPGTRSVVVEVLAGGAGGGGCATTGAGQVSAGASGGGGGYARKRITSGFSGVTVTVGAKGSGGAAGNNAGTAGGSSSFGALVSATGGSAGSGGAAGTAVYLNFPGGGGSGSSGDVNISGGSGGLVQVWAGPGLSVSGVGGDSFYGKGPPANVTGTRAAGLAGTGFGSGGGGGICAASQTQAPGGDGTPGIVIVWEYS
jgi:hypothetical protein